MEEEAEASRLRQAEKRVFAAALRRLEGASQDDNENFLDFVVAERPEYLPGSGPPLAPISIMPEHDSHKTGMIVSHFQHENHPRYVVTYTDKPQLRVSVAPENILNWVSAKTYEEYEWKRSEAEAQAKAAERRGKSRNSDPAQQIFEARDDGEPKVKGKPGRKRKRPLEQDSRVIEAGGSSIKGELIRPSSRVGKKEPVVEEPDFTSPQRPTLASPSAQRSLANIVDSDDESEDDQDSELPTEIAIETQLQSTMASRFRSPVGTDASLSASPSPEPIKVRRGPIRNPNQLLSSRDTRSSSRQTRGSVSRSASASTANGAKRQSFSTRQDSNTPISSREARRVYDELERKDKTPKKSTIVSRYSTLKKSEPELEPEPEPAEDQDEYQVEEILGEETISTGKKGKPTIYYHIKWLGFSEITMEPHFNVGDGAVASYEAKKRKGTLSKMAYKVTRPDGEVVTVGGNPEPVRARRQVVDDEDEDEDPDDDDY